MPYLDDVFRDIHEAEAAVGRRARADARASALGPGGAALLNDLAERYPHLSPDSLMALGRGGYGPDDPVTIQLANLEAQRHLADFPGGRLSGAPGVTPGQRRVLSQRGEQPVPTWQPQSGNPDAAAAWEDAKRQGLVVDGILTIPHGPDDHRRPAYDAVLDRLTAAGEEVPVMRFQEGGDAGPQWIPSVARRNIAADLSPAEELHATGVEMRRAVANRIDYEDLVAPESTGGGTGFGEGIGAGITSRLPGAESRRRGEIEQARGTQSAGVNEIRSLFRTAFAAQDAPVQEIQGLIRNLYGATHGRNVDWWETQSDLGVMLTSGITDAGQGFFVDPESAVAEERRRREAERGQIGGHNITLGRWVADAANFDPNTKPALLLSGAVDLGVQMADPTAYLFGKAGEVREARSLFAAADLATEGEAGVVRGLRTLVSPVDARRWLDGPEGIDRLNWLSRVSSPTEIWQGMNRKITMDFARDLADANTPDAVRALLEPELGRSIREVSTVAMPMANRFGAQVSPVTRVPSIMPSRGPIDAWDKDVVAHELERWMTNGGADQTATRRVLDNVARAEGQSQLNAAIRDAIRDVDGALARAGIPQKMRDRLLRLHGDNVEASRVIHEMVMTNQAPTYNSLSIGGETADLPSPMLFVEHAPRHVTLPDARDIRRVQSRFARILANGETGKLRIGFTALEAIQNELWKPVQLVTRFAWPVRVIGEEQLRMAAAGYDSMYRHPLSFIANRLGRKNASDVLGDPIEEANQLKGTLTHTHGGWLDRPAISSHRYVAHRDVLREREAFVQGWGSEIARLYGDPVANRVNRSATLDEAKDWLNRGGGLAYKRDMAVMHPESFASEADANRWLEQTIDPRLRNAHGGDPELVAAITTGKFRGKDIFDGSRLDKGFLGYLDSRVDDIGPDAVIAEAVDLGHGSAGRRWRDWADDATDRLFAMLMSNRTNNLSRQPTFKQEYWREAERLLPALDPEAKAAFLGAAEAANVDGWRIGNRALKRMRSTAAIGDLTLEDLDFLAKGHALDRTKELLYDLTRKGRTADAWRIVFPFGEAWSEVLTRWFGRNGIVWQNPKTIRRFQQIVQGARGADFGQLMGAPEGEGFFWENGFGEEVFTYPGSALLTQHTLGVPVPLTGRVQGLSMFGTILPGLGPVAQIPTGWFLANKPGPQQFKDFLTDVENTEVNVGGLDFGTVKEQVLPFGAIGTEDASDIWSADNYVPSWIRAALQAATGGDQSEAQWANTVMETAAYLQTTGQYGDSPEERQRLYEDASHKARGLFFIKAAAGSIAPSSPDMEFMVRNDRGDLLRLAALRDEWHDLLDPDKGGDYRSAAQTFLERYGEDITAIVSTSMTTSARVGTPTTREGVAWVEKNPEVRDALRHTYGLFAPQGGPDDFTIYDQEMHAGERERLNPRIWVQLLNNTKGNLLWSQAQDMLGGSRTRAQQQWLRDVADEIRAAYPGWGDTAGLLEKPTTETMIDELERAVDLPALQGTDAVAGLRLYLEARDKAQANAEAAGLQSFDTAQSMEGTRMWLNDVAEAIMREHPDFEPLWTFVFSHETRTEEQR